MALARKVFGGTLIIAAGEGITQACNLIRNIVLARVLTKADFGTAALLGMTVSIFEIGGRLSIENCVIQSKDGERPRFMAVAHLIQVVLGLVSGILIFVAARPMADFFDVPSAAWALRVLALLPLLRSLSHLDVYRMSRDIRFGPGVMIEIVPQLAITIAVWPLTYFWKSYVVLVWLLIGKQVASTLASHFVAERPYRWAYDLKLIRDILTFGWPMLISGLLMFGTMQGDRFAVGIKFSVAELGVYAVAGSLALLPAGTLLKLSGSILLPLLSSAKNDVDLFRVRLAHAAEVLALFSGAYAVVMIVAGGPLVALLFGAKYREAGALAAWLGLGQALRLLRGVPTVGAMAKGDTKNLMYSNLFRLTGLGLAFPLAMAGVSLTVIASCAAIGEAVALVGSFWRFTRIHQIAATVYLPALSLATVFIVLSSLLSWLGLAQSPGWISLGTAVLLVLGLVVIHFMIFDESRQLLLAKLLPHISSRFKPVGQ
jgi:O-antigen/teichoic acid export membrane protein